MLFYRMLNQFYHKVLNSETLVPQRRRRCFMVAFREPVDEFEFPILEGAQSSDCIQPIIISPENLVKVQTLFANCKNQSNVLTIRRFFD